MELTLRFSETRLTPPDALEGAVARPGWWDPEELDQEDRDRFLWDGEDAQSEMPHISNFDADMVDDGTLDEIMYDAEAWRLQETSWEESELGRDEAWETPDEEFRRLGRHLAGQGTNAKSGRMARDGWRDQRVWLEQLLENYRIEWPHGPQVYMPFRRVHSTYWNYFNQKGMPPTQVEFVYLLRNLGIASRRTDLNQAARLYPFLVRRHHFELLLREHFDTVRHSKAEDPSDVDFKIVMNGQEYGINLAVETAGGRVVTERKLRQRVGNLLPVIDLAVRPPSTRDDGIWLHPLQHIDQVKQFVRSGAFRT